MVKILFHIQRESHCGARLFSTQHRQTSHQHLAWIGVWTCCGGSYPTVEISNRHRRNLLRKLFVAQQEPWQQCSNRPSYQSSRQSGECLWDKVLIGKIHPYKRRISQNPKPHSRISVRNQNQIGSMAYTHNRIWHKRRILQLHHPTSSHYWYNEL